MITKTEAKTLALKTNPELDRLLSVVSVEIQHAAKNGKFRLTFKLKPDQKEYFERLWNSLINPGFQVKSSDQSEGILIEWI